jgi:hypothetical protein
MRIPAVLEDLFYDLRDRRLLPLVALIVVAIIAVPFLLASTEHRAPAGGLPTAIASAGGAGPRSSRMTVVLSKPGLRSPNKRLAHLPAKDPFVQQYTSPVLKAGAKPTSQTTASTSSTSSTTGSNSTTSGSGNSPGSSSPAPGSSGASTKPRFTFYSFAIEVKISRTERKSPGAKATTETSVRQKVLPTTPLPDKQRGVATYLGVSPKTRKPLFLVSNEVKGLIGEGVCLSGAGTCQLLEVEPGFPETFVREGGDTYRIDVLKIEPVITGHS